MSDEASEATVVETSGKSAEAQPAEPERKYFASIFPGPSEPLLPELGEAVFELQNAFGMPVWLLIQADADSSLSVLDSTVRRAFFKCRGELADCPRSILVIDSGGGDAEVAYEIGRLFQRRRGFVAVVPRFAKSAATLLALGGEEIYMGRDAELGPLDAQLGDPEREEVRSALDEVQALERLHLSSLEQIDHAMTLLLGRTGKKVETLLPIVMDFVTKMMEPLLRQIDTVHYTAQSRVLKVAEDYAVRLLQPRYSRDDAEDIARRLVNRYSEHRFVIDETEAREFLSHIGDADKRQRAAITRLNNVLEDTRAIALGKVEAVTADTEGDDE